MLGVGHVSDSLSLSPSLCNPEKKKEEETRKKKEEEEEKEEEIPLSFICKLYRFYFLLLCLELSLRRKAKNIKETI